MSREKPSFGNFLSVSNPGKKLLYILPAILFLAVIAVNELVHALKQGYEYGLAGGLISLVGSMLCVAFVYQYSFKEYKDLRDVFMKGVEVQGTIVDIHIGRKLGYVIYEYNYQNRSYRSEDRIQESEKSKQMHVGQKVMLYVNPQNLTQAFIRDLYLNTF